ncbi:MAG: hypothetical protein DWI12_08085 [Planctomycetota bacterium]|nr:MAG: hypothetical protein DWI12_08085 [Planctomycetota bacterium]
MDGESVALTSLALASIDEAMSSRRTSSDRVETASACPRHNSTRTQHRLNRVLMQDSCFTITSLRVLRLDSNASSGIFTDSPHGDPCIH